MFFVFLAVFKMFLSFSLSVLSCGCIFDLLMPTRERERGKKRVGEGGGERDRQTDRQTKRQTEKERDRWGGYADRRTEEQTDGQTNILEIVSTNLEIASNPQGLCGSLREVT